MTEREQILAGLQPLFEKARREGLWFESIYQNIPFSPQELEKEQANGRFVWGAVNWRLIDPKTLLRDPKADKRKAEETK